MLAGRAITVKGRSVGTPSPQEKVAVPGQELKAALEQQAATSAILRAIAASPSDIQPVLKASCYQCHGPERREAGLRLDSRAAVLNGGAGGPAIVPGRSAQSRMVQRLLGQG